MEKLSIGQRKSISTMLGNVAVAWLVAGVISPIITRVPIEVDFLVNFTVSFLLIILFAFYSLKIVKNVRS